MWFLRRRQNKSTEEADTALKDAQKNLRRVKRRGDEVSDVSSALKQIREHNHFAEQIEAIMHRQGKTP